MVELSKELLHILQHSLGVNEYGEGEQFRNHFCAGGDDVARCRQLAEYGYMKENTRIHPSLSGGSPAFNVTPEGIDAVALQSPTKPKLSRSKQRYQEYRDVSECYESFKHFLQCKYGKRA